MGTERNTYGIQKPRLDCGHAVAFALCDKQRLIHIDFIHIEQQGSGACALLTPVLHLTSGFVYFVRRAILDHCQNIVCVIVVKNRIAVDVLPDIAMVECLCADFSHSEICVNNTAISFWDFSRVVILSFSTDSTFTKAAQNTRFLEELFGGLTVRETAHYICVDDVDIASTTKTVEVVHLCIVDKARGIFVVNRA